MTSIDIKTELDKIFKQLDQSNKIIKDNEILYDVEALLRCYEVNEQRAKSRLHQFILSEQHKLYKGWLDYVESGGGHISRQQLKEGIAELESQLQEYVGKE